MGNVEKHLKFALQVSSDAPPVSDTRRFFRRPHCPRPRNEQAFEKVTEGKKFSPVPGLETTPTPTPTARREAARRGLQLTSNDRFVELFSH